MTSETSPDRCTWCRPVAKEQGRFLCVLVSREGPISALNRARRKDGESSRRALVACSLLVLSPSTPPPTSFAMSSFDRVRAPGGDLASFFRSLASPGRRYGFSSSTSAASSSANPDFESEQLRARQGGTKHLEFFDHGLVGPRGAKIVLNALTLNPGANSVTLVSHHQAGELAAADTAVSCGRAKTI
jgi:hypothetical protein